MKTIEVSELIEHINELPRLIEKGEIITLIEHGKVIAHIVPALTPELQTQTEQNMEAFWERTERLAAEIGSYLPEKIDINDIMRDIRRDL